MASKNPSSAARSAFAARSRRSPRPSAPVGSSLVEEHLRPGHRRREGPHLAAASTLEKDLKGSLKTGADTAAAAAVGKLIAERAAKAGVKEVVFDRGAYIYHGRVKALAEAAREGGLNF